jgi:cysteine desulfurase
MIPVYLDYNASALVRPQVRAVMAEALADNGNPSAVHAAGRRARSRMETAREQVAALVGASAAQVVFCSGGTEANAQGIASAVAAGCERLIVSATEHPCVALNAAAHGLPVETAPVDGWGLVDLDWIAGALRRPGRALVAVHHANNETGVIQPIAQIAALTRAADGWLHVDAVQSAGKVSVELDALGVDTLTLSAHKLGGPQGVGALVMREGAPVVRTLHGAGQEKGLRAGTENVPGISGFGAAAEAALQELPAIATHAAWRDAAEAKVEAAGAFAAGKGRERLPNTSFFAVPDWPAALQLIALDLQGIMISAGSACSSGKSKPSAAMLAMGHAALATGGVRVSGGWGTVEDDWVRFADAWVRAYEGVRARVREVA